MNAIWKFWLEVCLNVLQRLSIYFEDRRGKETKKKKQLVFWSCHITSLARPMLITVLRYYISLDAIHIPQRHVLSHRAGLGLHTKENYYQLYDVDVRHTTYEVSLTNGV